MVDCSYYSVWVSVAKYKDERCDIIRNKQWCLLTGKKNQIMTPVLPLPLIPFLLLSTFFCNPFIWRLFFIITSFFHSQAFLSFHCGLSFPPVPLPCPSHFSSLYVNECDPAAASADENRKLECFPSDPQNRKRKDVSHHWEAAEAEKQMFEHLTHCKHELAASQNIIQKSVVPCNLEKAEDRMMVRLLLKNNYFTHL